MKMTLSCVAVTAKISTPLTVLSKCASTGVTWVEVGDIAINNNDVFHITPLNALTLSEILTLKNAIFCGVSPVNFTATGPKNVIVCY